MEAKQARIDKVKSENSKCNEYQTFRQAKDNHDGKHPQTPFTLASKSDT